MLVDVATFYRFARLSDPVELRSGLYRMCGGAGIKGSVLLAEEGINGTLAGEPAALSQLMDDIRALTGILDLPVQTARAETQPFLRLKVRCKAEIVTLGDRTVDPLRMTGIRVPPSAWNALLADPEVMLIDTRNAFEIEAGSFPAAIDPGTRSFGAFPAFVRGRLATARNRKVAMFCTGGIRCEKASSFMLREGFSEIYQLEGGILAYLEQIAPAESLWKGDCFVFDGRVGVGHGLAQTGLTQCFGCRHPLTPVDRSANAYEDGVSCPHCIGVTSDLRRASARERHKQAAAAAARGGHHLGSDAQAC